MVRIHPPPPRRRVLHIVRDGVFFFKANAISPSFRRSSLSKPNPLRWASVWGLAMSFFIKNSSFAHSAAHRFRRTNAALVCTAIKALCGAAIFLIAPTKAQRSGLCEERTSKETQRGMPAPGRPEWSGLCEDETGGFRRWLSLGSPRHFVALLPTPFVPAGHFPLIGGIGPLARGALRCAQRTSQTKWGPQIELTFATSV